MSWWSGGASLFCIPFYLLGFIFVEDALQRGLDSRRISRDWIPVPSKVLSKAVVPAWKSGDQATYRPAVVFEYDIGNVTYRSDHLDALWQSGSSNTAGAEEAIAGYHPGQSVTARVNPADPRDAVLDASPRVSWLGLFTGVVFASMGLLFGYAILMVTGDRVRFRPLDRWSSGAKPHFGLNLWLPAIYLGLWGVLSLIGFACGGIAQRTPGVAWGALSGHLAIGLLLLAWVLRKFSRRRPFYGSRIIYGAAVIPTGSDVTWTLQSKKKSLKNLRFSLVYREAVPVNSDTETMEYRDRIFRSLTGLRSEGGWAGTLIVGSSDPRPSGGFFEAWGSWAVAVNDGTLTVYYPLPGLASPS